MSDFFKLNDGASYIVADVAGGIYSSEQLAVIANLVNNYSAVARAVEDQRIGLIVKTKDITPVKTVLKESGMNVGSYYYGSQPTSCVGSLCPKYKQDALDTVINLINTIIGDNSDIPLKVVVNGCSQCCVSYHTADISIVATRDGYNMFVGGKSNQLPELATFVANDIPFEQINPKTIEIINWYKSNSKDNESLNSLIDRLGLEPIIKILSPYSQDASQKKSLFTTDSSPESAQESINSAPSSTSNTPHDNKKLLSLDNNNKLKDSAMNKNKKIYIDDSDESLVADINIKDATKQNNEVNNIDIINTNPNSENIKEVKINNDYKPKKEGSSNTNLTEHNLKITKDIPYDSNSDLKNNTENDSTIESSSELAENLGHTRRFSNIKEKTHDENISSDDKNNLVHHTTSSNNDSDLKISTSKDSSTKSTIPSSTNDNISTHEDNMIKTTNISTKDNLDRNESYWLVNKVYFASRNDLHIEFINGACVTVDTSNFPSQGYHLTVDNTKIFLATSNKQLKIKVGTLKMSIPLLR